MVNRNNLFFYDINKNNLINEKLYIQSYHKAIDYKFDLEPYNLKIISGKYKPNLFDNVDISLRISNTTFLYDNAIYDTIKRNYNILSYIIKDGNYVISLKEYIKLNLDNKLNENRFLDYNNIVYYKLFTERTFDDKKYIDYEDELDKFYFYYKAKLCEPRLA